MRGRQVAVVVVVVVILVVVSVVVVEVACDHYIFLSRSFWPRNSQLSGSSKQNAHWVKPNSKMSRQHNHTNILYPFNFICFGFFFCVYAVFSVLVATIVQCMYLGRKCADFTLTSLSEVYDVLQV